MNRNEFVVFDWDYDHGEEEIETAEEDEKKMNSRRVLLSAYAIDILRNETSPWRPMTQERLIRKLDQFPYDLSVQRQALGRMLHTLADEDLGIHISPAGAWYEGYPCTDARAA